MTTLVLAQNEWAYVAGGYGITVGALVLFTIATILKGRRVGRQVPVEERRWL